MMNYQSLFVFILFPLLFTACTTPNFMATSYDVPVMDGVMHTVHEGDTIDAIAETYDVTSQRIRRVNNLQTDVNPQPGTRLFIPGAQELRVVNVDKVKKERRDGLYHWVAPGETLIAIANAYKEYGVTVDELQRVNNIPDAKKLRAGQEIWIPRGMEVKDVDIPKFTVKTESPIPAYQDEKKEPRVQQQIVSYEKDNQEADEQDLPDETQTVVQTEQEDQEEQKQEITQIDQVDQEEPQDQEEKTTPQEQVSKSQESQTQPEPEGEEVEFPRKIERVGELKFQWPLKDNFRVLRSFSSSMTNYNAGIDLGAEIGTPVYAAAHGEIQLVGSVTDELGSSYGNHIILYHGTRNNKGMRTFYAHLNETAVEVGQEIERGELIGRIGNTGRPSVKESGVLHFEVRELGNAMDPMDVLPPLD